MERSNEKRLEAAKPILEDHHKQLLRTGNSRGHKLECDLRACWGQGAGNLTVKRFMVELLQIPRYKLLAAHFMQFVNAPGPASELKRHLAKFYGQTIYNHEGALAFWKSFKTSK